MIFECNSCRKWFGFDSDCGCICVCPDCLKVCNEDCYRFPFDKLNIYWGEEKVGTVEKRTNSVVKSHVVYNIYYYGGQRRVENPKDLSEIYDVITKDAITEIDNKFKKVSNDKAAMIDKFIDDFSKDRYPMWLLERGDISRYHDVVTISKEHSGKWVIFEARLSDRFSFSRKTEISESFSSVDDFKRWITRFVDRYFDVLYSNSWPMHEGLSHIEDFGTVINCKKK